MNRETGRKRRRATGADPAGAPTQPPATGSAGKTDPDDPTNGVSPPTDEGAAIGVPELAETTAPEAELAEIDGDEAPGRAIVVLTTAEDAETLARLGRVLVNERLAACVTIVPAARSIYRWHDGIEESGEAIGIIKTTHGRYPALEKRWREIHPYELPEILVLPVAGGLPDYLAWLVDATAEPPAGA